MAMSSSRPYLVRALYEWILDNQCTPHILVDALHRETRVPQEYVQNGQIVLNISTSAVTDLLIENDCLSFRGRFGGVPQEIFAPMAAVLGIYARENGQGMIFEPGSHEPEPDPEQPDPTEPDPTPSDDGNGEGAARSGRPSLRVVK